MMELSFQSWSYSDGNRSVWGLLLTVWMSLLIQWTLGKISITPDVITAAVGDTVTLSVQHSVSIVYFNWYRGTRGESQNQILGFYNGSLLPYGRKYTGRETGLPDGSLKITDVLTNYTGNYTVQIQFQELYETTAQLTVYDTVTKPRVTFNNLQPVELQDSIEVTCAASPAAETVRWLFNNHPLLINNRINLSAQNRTLSISNVSRSDSGRYECEAVNPVSHRMSDPHALTVAYGPEDVRIEPSRPHMLQAGATLTLTCTAGSVPETDRYEWFRDNIKLKTTGRQLVLSRVSSEHQGNYTCMAQNTRTLQSANASTSIAVNEPASQSAAVAGIVVAVLVALILAAALVYFLLAKRSMKTSTVYRNSTGAPPDKKKAANNQSGSTEEIQYSTVCFPPNKERPTMPKTTEDIIYSEVTWNELTGHCAPAACQE